MGFLLKLYEQPPRLILWGIIAISLVGFLILNALMGPIEIYLKSISPYGVLDLEFIWTVDQAQIITAAWGSEGIGREIYVTYLDFGYLICYSTFFAGIYLILIRIIHARQLIIAETGKKIVMGVLIPYMAAVLDIIENINIVIILQNPSIAQPINAFLTSICATFKFTLLVVALISIIICLMVLVFKKKARAERKQ